MPTPDPTDRAALDPDAAYRAGRETVELMAHDVDVVHLLGLPIDLGTAAHRLGTIARFAAVDADAELGLVRRHDGPPTT